MAESVSWYQKAIKPDLGNGIFRAAEEQCMTAMGIGEENASDYIRTSPLTLIGVLRVS